MMSPVSSDILDTCDSVLLGKIESTEVGSSTTKTDMKYKFKIWHVIFAFWSSCSCKALGVLLMIDYSAIICYD